MGDPWDDFDKLPPFDPARYDPNWEPPQAAIEKIHEASKKLRSSLGEEDLEFFNQLMTILTALGFGTMAEREATGRMPDLRIGQIMGLSDRSLIAFVDFASDLSNIGIDAIVPKDHPAYQMVSGGQLQMIMGLLVGYKLRQEQEGS